MSIETAPNIPDPSSVRSGMTINRVREQFVASLQPAAHMPLLRSLEIVQGGGRGYRHGAPNGA